MDKLQSAVVAGFRDQCTLPEAEANEYVKVLTDPLVWDWCVKQGMTTKLRWAQALAQFAHETMGFSKVEEILYYSAARLPQVWPHRFNTRAKIKAVLRPGSSTKADPAKLANSVYGGRMGNVHAGDGYRYRGRGWPHLTGRSNYTWFTKYLGTDIVNDPDKLIEDKVTAIEAAIAFFCTRKYKGVSLLTHTDNGSTTFVTRGINGGINGLADRKSRLQEIKSVMALEGGEGIDVAHVIYTRPIVRRGTKSKVVTDLQLSLKLLGAFKGNVGKTFGPKTEAAVKSYQRTKGLKDDGIVGSTTWGSIRADIALLS